MDVVCLLRGAQKEWNWRKLELNETWCCRITFNDKSNKATIIIRIKWDCIECNASWPMTNERERERKRRKENRRRRRVSSSCNKREVWWLLFSIQAFVSRFSFLLATILLYLLTMRPSVSHSYMFIFSYGNWNCILICFYYFRTVTLLFNRQ